jgi:peptide/nickel transport system substrate-binding protein
MTTRRQVLGYGSMLATIAAPVAQALAQNVTAVGNFHASGLVGTLESATIVSTVPTSFKEAPALAALVQQGKLPPVAQRLPAEPLVLKPLHEIGRYGGTWRRGFIGPSDGENGNRINSSDKLLLWDATGSRMVPGVAKGWELSRDGKTFTLFLRKGMKWSDGTPFTADDFTFWFEDIYSNKDIVPTPIADLSPAGRPGRLVKIDETTVEFRFDVRYFLFLDLMAGDTQIGGGQSVQQSIGNYFGAYSPAHYLRQFLPKYSSEANVNRMAREQGYDNWGRMLNYKKDWQLNPDLPTLGPWHTVKPINTPTWTMERNPYYWVVDVEGNQLPYIDNIVMTLAENPEVVSLRAMAGEYDMQARFIDLQKLPVLLDNRDRGNYDVHLDLAYNGADMAIQINLSYTADPEIAKWLHTADFRRALSLGIDRDQLNETFWLGLGTPGSVVPAEAMPQNPGPEWRKRWSTYDPDRANAMLDALGLTRKDAEGYRLRTDNGQRLVLGLEAINASMDYPKQMEMVAQQWRKIGIYGDVKQMERGIAFQRLGANQEQIDIWNNSGTELIYLFPRHCLPVDITEPHLGIEIAKWYASNGTQGMEPTDPELRRALELFRSAAGQQEDERNKTAQEIWKIIVEQQYSIGTVGQSPALQGVRVVSRRLGNIPSRGCIAQHCRTPGTSHPETWYFKA